VTAMPKDGQDDEQRGGVGAGAEAAAGLHQAKGDATNEPQGERTEGTDRRGSEPIARDREHKGSYGGEGGAPRTSSDQREASTPD
jgi:hypothetical protein